MFFKALQNRHQKNTFKPSSDSFLLSPRVAVLKASCVSIVWFKRDSLPEIGS